MSQRFTFDGKSYDLDILSDDGKSQVKALHFLNTRIDELSNLQILLQRAKNSYIEDLKKEMLSDKTGMLFD